ncbi:MAG: hypothetical protein R3C03_14230 [Pirellulaceae bacterium]
MKSNRKYRFVYRLAILCSIVFLFVDNAATFLVAQEAENGDRNSRRRRFDMSEYVKNLDRNQNGILDPDEMSERTKGFISRMGIDTSGQVKVADVLSKSEEFRNSRSQGSNDSKPAQSAPTFERKVPGFGVEASSENSPLPNFSASTSAGTGNAVTMSQFSDDVMESVDRAMRRYDKNGNGLLEPDEIKAGRWGQPSPEQSDTDHDGNLSRVELATRYSQRARAIENTTSEAPSRDTGRDSRRTSSQPIASRTSSRSGDFATAPNRYAKFADGLVEKYDKDGDGKLDKKEFQEIRRPPANADRDNDGFVTAGELADAYESGAGESDSSKSSGNANSSSTNERSSRGDSRRRTGTTSSSFSFHDVDANGDGQVQMHEFAQDWTDEILDDFRALDKNGDGVITLSESKKKE